MLYSYRWIFHFVEIIIFICLISWITEEITVVIQLALRATTHFCRCVWTIQLILDHAFDHLGQRRRFVVAPPPANTCESKIAIVTINKFVFVYLCYIYVKVHTRVHYTKPWKLRIFVKAGGNMWRNELVKKSMPEHSLRYRIEW